MYRKTYLKVNLDYYRENIEYIKKISGKKIICVLKADGYGTNDLFLAHAAIKEGCDFFAVSSYDEAVKLRLNGIDKEMLILGYVDDDALDLVKKYDLSVVTVSKDYVLRNKDKLKGIKVHLKLNTGMNRIGIRPEEAPEVLNILLESGAHIEGIMSHFARSDEDYDYTLKQFEIFKKCVQKLDYDFKYIHISNTDGALSVKDDISNYVRIGIGLLGYSAVDDKLKECLSMYSTISNVKTVPEGETVSYGGHYTSDGKGYILTVPVGYADGIIRKNTGSRVYVGNEYGTIVGSVCMDQLMIKTEHKHNVGEEVEFFGPHVSLKEKAGYLGTIPYEIMCLISDRVSRIFIEDGKEYLFSNRFEFENR